MRKLTGILLVAVAGCGATGVPAKTTLQEARVICDNAGFVPSTDLEWRTAVLLFEDARAAGMTRFDAFSFMGEGCATAGWRSEEACAECILAAVDAMWLR